MSLFALSEMETRSKTDADVHAPRKVTIKTTRDNGQGDTVAEVEERENGEIVVTVGYGVTIRTAQPRVAS